MANTTNPQSDRAVRRRRPSGQARHGSATGNAETNNSAAARDPVAANGASGAPEAGATGGAPQFNTRSALRDFVFRTLLMYAMWHFYAKPKTAPSTAGSAPATPATPSTPPIAGKLLTSLGVDLNSPPPPPYYRHQLTSHWSPGAALSLRVFMSLQPNMTFSTAAAIPKEDALYAQDGLTFDTSAENYRSTNVTFAVPDEVSRKNSSWFVHVFVVRRDMWDVKIDGISDPGVDENVLYATYNLITWLDEREAKEKKNLLGEQSKENEKVPKSPLSKEEDRDETGTSANIDEGEGNETEPKFRQVWRPTVPIVIVTTTSSVVLGQLPPNAANHYRVSEGKKSFFPPMHVDDFWTLESSLSRMNETVQHVRVEVSFTPMSLYKWSMYRQFENAWQKQMDFGTIRKKEVDELKRMFVETNPVLLITTMIVSFVHTILEVLAFRSDISHWKNAKSMEGVSVRSMIWKIAMEAIIFLYLWDNETSWMITLGNGVGLGIEIWKLTKAVKFENFGKRKLLGLIPWFEMTDRESYSKETKEYDEQAMKYLSYLVYPLVFGYALYSLRYEKHRSWYSWIINSLVGAVYAFGFIMMFPQIFINYKLKSVAHIPMKAMMYKTLNTIIDDLFSFIIKMPWLHRLACFRDDVVFLIILYQRWIYPVDTTRVNEFGQRFDADGNEIVGEDTDSNNDDVQKAVTTVKGNSTISTTGKQDGGINATTDTTDSSQVDAAERKSKAEKKND